MSTEQDLLQRNSIAGEIITIINKSHDVKKLLHSKRSNHHKEDIRYRTRENIYKANIQQGLIARIYKEFQK